MESLVSRFRRAGFQFVVWKGDHSPRHAHIYRDGKLVVKWDLENWQPMRGRPGARLLRLLRELRREGVL